jgi:hypothetical protein
MTEQEKRKKRCCFTGHRPEKLDRPEAEIIAWLETEIRKLLRKGLSLSYLGWLVVSIYGGRNSVTPARRGLTYPLVSPPE